MISHCMKRNVVSIRTTATIREAAKLMVECHIGLLPVVDAGNVLIGVLGLSDLLSLEMPAFFDLIGDLDFISDFGAVETTRPTVAEIDQPVTALMQSARYVDEDSGKLLAYALMIRHNLSDLPVVTNDRRLVGIVSRVDIGTAILSAWKEIEANP